MENTLSRNNDLTSGLTKPLDIQVALNVTQRCSIRLIKDIETGRLIPHYYFINRYVEDKYCDAIRGIIKNELMDLFSLLAQDKTFFNEPERFNELSVYTVSDLDKKKYSENTGFLNSLTKNVLKNILDSLDIVKDERDCDFDATLVNAQNGIVNLTTGDLLKHSPETLTRNIINARFINLYNNDGDSINIDEWESLKLFHKLINDALYDATKTSEENDAIVRSFMEILASFLIGNNVHKLVFILMGVPNAGKSTLVEILLGIFGGYGATFNNSALLMSSRTSNDIRPDIIALRGKRLLAGSEANKTGKFDNALVKMIAGNDKVSFRKPHKADMVTFTMTGKLVLITNFCPVFKDLDDNAFLNRIVLLDFNNAPKEFDTDLKEKLLTTNSRDQIFSYLVNIARDVLAKNEIFIHERFKANKQRILINQNSSVSLFWKEHIRPYEDYNVFANIMPRHPVKLLYSVMYCDFCRKHDLMPLKLEAFAKEFKELSDQFPVPTHKEGKSNNYYIGFDVVNGQADDYRHLINKSILDQKTSFSETLFQ